MNQYLLLVLIVLNFLSTGTQAQTLYPSGVSGCIARWTFDAAEGGGLPNIQDWSGNNNHGSNNGITSVTGWSNLPNRAGKFDGTTSWSDVPHSNSLNCPTEITMISLVKLVAFNNNLCQFNQVLSKGYPHFIAGNYGQGVGEGPYDNDCNIFSPNNEQLVSQCGTGSFVTTAGNYIQLNKWYFFATTISSTNVTNYQIEMDTNIKAPNITQINNTIGSYNIGINNQNISLGKHLNPQYPYWVNGEMDEVVLFNRVLTNSELYSVYEYLYGYPTKTNDISRFDDEYEITVFNNEIRIKSYDANYKYEVYNSIGQLLNKKTNCNNFETISFSSSSKEIVFIKIADKNNKVYYCSKLIN